MRNEWLRQRREQWNKAKAEDPEKVRRLRRKFLQQTGAVVGLASLVIVLVLSSTIAWFTNVSRTSDLMLSVEAWGIDAEKIAVDEAPILGMPGSSGFLSLSVDNGGDAKDISLSVSLSKAGMSEELQKRIYFYVDGADASGGTVEGESRRYLGAEEEARYTLLSGEKLILSEDFYSGRPIKWSWVYDMEGYYFQGTVTTDGAQVEEYLRPIEYDYDTAIFEEETGELVSVDGLSTAEFLKKLSESDGYEGTIDAELYVEAEGRRYYPVRVGPLGRGVWAYLCSRDEIEEGIRYDEQMAAGETEAPGEITVRISAQTLPAQRQTVRDEEELAQALKERAYDVIEVTNDIALTGRLVLEGEGRSVLSLNGYSLTCEDGSLFSVKDGAQLTILNGELRGGQTGGTAVEAVGAKVTLSGVDISEVDTALAVRDDGAQGDSTVRLVDCRLTTRQTSVAVFGNGSGTAGLTQVMIQDCQIESEEYFGLSGQGGTRGDGYWGTSITVLNSTISGKFAGIYHPQQRSTLLLNQCEVTGFTGVAVKGGTVTIRDSRIAGVGEEPQPAAAASGGFTDTGDGVYVEAGYSWAATVVLKGDNEVSSESANAVELFGVKDQGPGKILIRGGTYSGGAGAAAWNGVGRFEVFGGEFNGAVEERIARFDVQAAVG